MKIRKLNGSMYFLMAVILIMVAVIIESSQWESIQTKMLPLSYGILILILAAIAFIQELKRKKITKLSASKENEGKTEEPKEGWRGYLISGAWVIGFFLAIYLFGIILATVVFIASYMKSHGVRWLTIVLSSILTPAIMYALFEYLLGIILYRGLIYKLLV